MSNVAEVLKNETLVQRFEKTAPPAINYDKEVGFAIQHLKANDYLMNIANKDPNSLLAALSNVAFVGLSLNPAAKEAYLVPRKGKICLDPSYSGLIKLATDSGSILWVQANLVYSSDSFTDNGPGAKPTHTHDPFSEDRGEFVGAYCVAKTKEGDYLTTTMSAKEVFEIRNSSESVKKFGADNPKAGPWVSHFGEMAKKTVIRRAFKTWTRSDKIEAESRLAKAIDISNHNEGVELVVHNPRITDYSDEQKAFYDQLIEASNALGMYVFQETTDRGQVANLYHSFEKGTKGKFQTIVDDLYQRGHDEFQRYLEMWNEAVERDDQTGQEEIIFELTDDEFEFLRSRA